MAGSQSKVVYAIDIEIICSNPDEHRRRLEARRPNIPGISCRPGSRSFNDYRPWDGGRTVIDTSTNERRTKRSYDLARVSHHA